MRNVSELLREADPLRYELTPPARDDLREAIHAAVTGRRVSADARSRARIALLAAIAFIVIVASVGTRSWPLFSADVQAATIRFEVRLAEDKPAPGLHEAKVSNSGRSVYLHSEAIVANSDIAVAHVIPGGGPSEFYVGIEFNVRGSDRMRAATASHVGKILAILLDGQVVMAPVVRTPIGASAVISGHFTRPQAARIVDGIEAH